MKTAFLKGRTKTVISLLAALSLCVGACFCFGFESSALNEYNETEGTFDDFTEARINSDIEVKYGVNPYVQTTTFTHSGNSATIDTNAYVEWSTESDVAFLCKNYEVGGTGNENKMTFETSITARTDPSGGQNLFSTASGGLLLTDSDTDPSAPRIFLHLREGKVTVVYRSASGGGMGVIYGSVNAELPIKLKIVKSGKKYTCSYKGTNNGSYVTLGTVTSVMNGPLYAGVAAHSSDKTRSIRSSFKGWYAVGQGTYDNSGGGDDTPSKDEYPDTGYIDPSYDEATTLLYESFSKGIHTEGDAAVSPPIWQQVHTNQIKTLDNGNRVWYIAQETGSAFLGNQYWTDYSASVDVSFTAEMQAQDDDQFVFWVRRKEIENSGYYGNGVAITTDAKVDDKTQTVSYVTKLSVVKQYAQRATQWSGTDCSAEIPNLIGDGKTHNIKVYAVDNKMLVYFDGELLLDYTDTATDGHINLRGGIGFYTNAVDVTVDNILVEKVDDELGGDFDNIIGSRFDEDIPEYVYNFYRDHEIKYFNNDSTAAITK